MKHPKINLLLAALAVSCVGVANAADDLKGHDHAGTGAHAGHDAKPQQGGIVTVVKDVNYELVAKVAANCQRSGPWTPTQRFVTVRHMWDHHPVWRTVPIATDAPWKVGDLVYVNVEDCEAPLRAWTQ